MRNFETETLSNQTTLASLALLMSSTDEDGQNNLAKSHYNLAKLHYDRADLDNARQFFLKALELSNTLAESFTRFKIYGFLIRIASERLDDHEANEYIKQSERLLDNLSTSLGTLTSEYFYNSGVLATYKGDFKLARESFQLAYKKSNEENDPSLASKTLLALANNYYHEKDFEKALMHLKQLEELLKIINRGYLAGAMYKLFGNIYSELNQTELALKFYKDAMDHLKAKKCWNLGGHVMLRRGAVHKKRGEFEKALIFFDIAQELADSSNFRRLINLINNEILDVNDSNIDLYLDKDNRKVVEKDLGVINFKHRFVLLEILFLLAKNPGQFYDKEGLARMIWKDEYNPLIHDKLIYTSVSRLRKLIEPESIEKSSKQKYIIRGKDGYTFNPEARIRFHLERKTYVDKAIANVEISMPV